MTKKPGSITIQEGIDRLVREFGAEVAVTINPHVFYTAQELAKSRRKINANLLNSHREVDVATYEFSELSPSFTVVWDRHVGMSHPARMMVRKTLAEGGVWDTHVNHLWCVPDMDKSSRAITNDDLALYRPWLLEALQAAGARHVLLVGSRAAWQWRSDLRLSMTQGRVFVWQSRHCVMPVESPDKVDKGDYPEWRRMVLRFCNVPSDNISHHLGMQCIQCPASVYWYDTDGVPWCREHAEQGVENQTKGREKWLTATMFAGQRRLLPDGE